MSKKIDWKNKEEVKEYKNKKNKESYQKNKENKKKYYQEHKEKIEEYQKEYRKKNKERLRRYDLKRKHKPSRVAYHKKYREKPEVQKYRRRYIKKYNQKIKEEENKRRQKLKLPLIGEGFKAEMELLVYVHRLFGNYEILTHHRNWGAGRLEIDIYIPELKLAFEYMGEQHYDEDNFYRLTKHNRCHEDFEVQQYRDRCKKKICKLKGITLIKIRYDEKLSEQLILSKLKHLKQFVSVQERLI